MSSVLACWALRESLPMKQIPSAGTDEQRDSAAEKAEVSHSSEVEGPASAANGRPRPLGIDPEQAHLPEAAGQRPLRTNRR